MISLAALVIALSVHSSPSTLLTIMPFESAWLDDHACRTLDDILTHDIASYTQYQVVSFADINAMLSVERAKDAVGCTDVNCLAEVTAALGARYMVVGRVRELAGQLIFSVALYDVYHSQVVRRAQVSYSDDAYFFSYAMHDLTQRLFAAERTPRRDTDMATSLHPPKRYANSTQASPARSAGFYLRVTALEQESQRRFRQDELALLLYCDALEAEMAGVTTLPERDDYARRIRRIRAEIGLAPSLHWPPQDSCF